MVFLKINLLLAALGLGCCSQAFSSCSERGLLSNCGAGLLTAVASVVEHGPYGSQASGVVAPGLNGCGS